LLFGQKDIDADNIFEIAKNDSDKMFIGEFIRRNHPRIAHEIALYGLKAEEYMARLAKP